MWVDHLGRLNFPRKLLWQRMKDVHWEGWERELARSPEHHNQLLVPACSSIREKAHSQVRRESLQQFLRFVAFGRCSEQSSLKLLKWTGAELARLPGVAKKNWWSGQVSQSPRTVVLWPSSPWARVVPLEAVTEAPRQKVSWGSPLLFPDQGQPHLYHYCPSCGCTGWQRQPGGMWSPSCSADLPCERELATSYFRTGGENSCLPMGDFTIEIMHTFSTGVSKIASQGVL